MYCEEDATGWEIGPRSVVAMVSVVVVRLRIKRSAGGYGSLESTKRHGDDDVATKKETCRMAGDGKQEVSAGNGNSDDGGGVAQQFVCGIWRCWPSCRGSAIGYRRLRGKSRATNAMGAWKFGYLALR